ncbi:tryptophan--tRNA ligase [Desulfosarcina sp.]|uniref:tryptophan--tRNA ligase n=1 Tax=Desulfosarcina sp. TaxID=2027861 RepID=UPI0035645CE3
MESTEISNLVLTGIKPTGRIHLGNYLGAIRPALELASKHRAYFFIADYHALTTIQDRARFNRRIEKLAATWLALGLDPERVVFYRQSAIPEIFELMWVLGCISPKGWLNRAHAYKGAVEANLAAGRDADAQVNAGLYNYPVLMAADILAFQTDLVPVGRDQRQHVEMAREMAEAFNRAYGPVLKRPQALVNEAVHTVSGQDGRKMSKSYGNEIPVLAQPDELRRLVMRIVTDSRPPEAPKDPEQCNLYALYRHFADHTDALRLRKHYREGGVAYQTVKQALAETLIDHFKPARERFAALMADGDQIEKILDNGAARAREVARTTLMAVRQAVGIDRMRPL